MAYRDANSLPFVTIRHSVCHYFLQSISTRDTLQYVCRVLKEPADEEQMSAQADRMQTSVSEPCTILLLVKG